MSNVRQQLSVKLALLDRYQHSVDRDDGIVDTLVAIADKNPNSIAQIQNTVKRTNPRPIFHEK